jgi:hypothetical protein
MFLCRSVVEPQRDLGAQASPSRMRSPDPKVVVDLLADDTRTATLPLGAGERGQLRHRWCEGPIRRTREGGSEWEPIKILLDGDENSNKTNTTTNTRLRLTTQVGQAHVATGVPLDLGTNTHNLPTRERSGTANPESTDPHRSDR